MFPNGPYSKERCDNTTKLITGTINAPRPNWIDGPTLWECIKSCEYLSKWKPHLIALFEEVDIVPLHDAVLCNYISFRELDHLFQSLEISSTKQSLWIAEMAELGVLRDKKINL
jgi:hypothetical protein